MGHYKLHEASWNATLDEGIKDTVFQKQFRDPDTGHMLRVTYTEGESETMPMGSGCGEVDLYLKDRRKGGRRDAARVKGAAEFWALYRDLITRSHNDIDHHIVLQTAEGTEDLREYEFHTLLMDNIPGMLKDPEVEDALSRASYSRPTNQTFL
jgi:hypothetical protein